MILEQGWKTPESCSK